MKQLFILFAFVIASFVTMGQPVTIDLTFTAVDSTDYIQLDSIKVMNRTQGGETMAYFPDTTLSLEINPGDLLLYVGYATQYPVGVQQAGQEITSFQLFQNYPNPVKDKSVILVNVPEKGTVNMRVTDVQGRVLLASDWQLDRGTHSFRFAPGNGNLFFLTAWWNEMSRSIKILTAEQNHGQKCILDYTGSSIGKPVLKTFSRANSFTSLESGIIDAPDADKTYTFQFASGIPCPGIPDVEYEGQTYNTLQILSQCWLKENLNTGTMITGTIEQSDNRTIEKYCYNNEPNNCITYGGLYQWNETMQYATVQPAKGICPPGWHLPMDEEWKVLEGAVDGQYGFADPEWDTEGYRGFNAGGSLKETGTAHWSSPNAGATNSSGFTGLPGGNTDYGTGDFTAVGTGGSFWSSSPGTTDVAWYRALNYASPHAYRKYIDKASGYSVRCLKGCAPVHSFAGENASVCEGSGYTLSGASAANYAGLLWTTSGTGSFDDPTLLNATYTPSQEDLITAEVMLTLTASGGGVCPDTASSTTLTILGAPVGSAGEDLEICSTQNSCSLNGTATNYSSVLWTSSGTGTFNDPASLTTIYTPSPVDKYAGLITLTLTVHGNSPCEPVSDAMDLRIWTGTANAGPDQPGVAGTSTTLAGNTPTFGLGLWQIVSGTGGDITDPNDPVSEFYGLIEHDYSLTWTISNSVCGTSVDTVLIGFTSCGLDITYEGQSYATVLIGDQCWMAENLNVGMMVPVEDMMSDNGVMEKYCYEDDQANCDIYGGLYTWFEAMQYLTTEGAQGICPAGWHLPTDAEVKILEGTVDSQYPVGDPVWDLLGWRGFDAGGSLKEAGLAHWYPPNEGATNSSGFTTLPAGWAAYGDNNFLGQDGYFWTSSLQSDWVWIRFMWCAMAGVNRGSWPPDYGISTRCLKDVEFLK